MQISYQYSFYSFQCAARADNYLIIRFQIVEEPDKNMPKKTQNPSK